MWIQLGTCDDKEMFTSLICFKLLKSNSWGSVKYTIENKMQSLF